MTQGSSFLPFVAERDKLSRLIQLVDSAKESKKKHMSPASHRRQMNNLGGNKLLVKMKKTPKVKIAKGLGEQLASEGS